MERELWSQLSRAILDTARTRRASARFTHDMALIVRVYLWAVLHDRPVYWACEARHWDYRTRPKTLPSQSTMSRRLRSQAIVEFMAAVARRVNGQPDVGLIKAIDGKPLTVSRHSLDAQATWGYGQHRVDRGYKLHAIWADTPMPIAWDVQPLNVHEKVVAQRLIPQLSGGGYLLADTNYDGTQLYDLSAGHGHQLLAPRACPGRGLGHRRHSAYRLRAIELLEGPGDFGWSIYQQRRHIESHFGGLTSFGGGLVALPAWVRGHHRVRQFVHAKLIINAARLRTVPQRRPNAV